MGPTHPGATSEASLRSSCRAQPDAERHHGRARLPCWPAGSRV